MIPRVRRGHRAEGPRLITVPFTQPARTCGALGASSRSWHVAIWGILHEYRYSILVRGKDRVSYLPRGGRPRRAFRAARTARRGRRARAPVADRGCRRVRALWPLAG